MGREGRRTRVTDAHLKLDGVLVFLPVRIPLYARRSRWREEANAIESRVGPSPDVEDPSWFIGEDETGCTEDLVLDV
jgi:hypothetical protein